MMPFFPGSRRSIEVPCTVDIERSTESLHAYMELEGVEVGPGDQVMLIGSQPDVPDGEQAVFRRRAMVLRATWLDRLWAHVEGYLELTELYEVGFEGRHS